MSNKARWVAFTKHSTFLLRFGFIDERFLMNIPNENCLLGEGTSLATLTNRIAVKINCIMISHC